MYGTTEAIKRGLDFMDTMHPGWHEKINLRNFQISSYTRCVIGQFTGDFSETIAIFGPNNKIFEKWLEKRGYKELYCLCPAEFLGMDSPSDRYLGDDCSKVWDYMQEMWEFEIQKRKKKNG